MAKRAGDELHLPKDADETTWTSPVKALPTRSVQNAITRNQAPKVTQHPSKADTASTDANETHLRQELANVRRVNEAMEGVLASLNKAKNNMKSVNQSVGSASALLDIWTRILSQTEHNQRLILDPSWQGASQDVTDMEDEAVAKQQAAERKENEEQERRAAAAKKVEEDERQKTAASTAKPKTSTRGRGNTGRGSNPARSGYVATTTTTTSANTSTSSISRGTSGRRTTRGLSRGTRAGSGSARG